MSEYFEAAADAASAQGRFTSFAEQERVTFFPGLFFRPVLGERLLVNQVTIEPHIEVPTHAHVEEQVVVVVEGEMEFLIGEEWRPMRPGDLAVVPPWVPHGARTADTRCVELDIFTPPRRQLLELLRPAE